VCAKRLERGRFSWPLECNDQGRVRISQEELALLLGGIELTQTRRKNWYRKESFLSKKVEEKAGN
jgi:transposase